MTEVWTIKRMLDWSEEFLRQRGSESPRLDAELLLGEVLELPKLRLYTEFDRPLVAAELAAYKSLIVRRAGHEPVAYILGNRGFHAIDLKVTKGVLVPRPETEHLVDFTLAFLNGDDAPAGPVVDVGTGTGAVALAVNHGLDNPRPIWAVDVAPDALRCAESNVVALDAQQTVEVLEGDLLEPAMDKGPFAAVISNPPYVRSDVIPTLTPTVRDHEPHLALDGGEDGLDLIRRLVSQAGEALVSGGLFAVELGSRAQGEAVVQLLTTHGFHGATYRPIGPGPTGLVTATAP